MYVCVCIVCISVYCMNMCVLYVLLVYTCIACICMDGLYCVYSVYLHVSACIVCIRNFVCMCMYCLYMSVYLKTFFQIHAHTCTYIHTYNTYKIQICCKCMYVYVFSGKYIHHTDSRFHIQTNTNMQVPWWQHRTRLPPNQENCHDASCCQYLNPISAFLLAPAAKTAWFWVSIRWQLMSD